MGDPVTNEGASPSKGPGIGKAGIGLATHWPHHRGVKIDEVCVIAGEMLIVIDAMGIVADRARCPTASQQMPTMPTKTTGAIFFERGIGENVVPVMTTITQGIDGEILGNTDTHLIALPQDRAVQGTMRAIGPRAANFATAITIMAGRTVYDAVGIQRGLVLAW